jgi:kynurenine formamidase
LDEDTPYIPVPGITFPFRKTPIATVAKDGVAAYRWDIHEHLGTQIDAPSHFFDGGRSLDQLPIDSLVIPLAVIDVSTRAASNADLADGG